MVRAAVAGGVALLLGASGAAARRAEKQSGLADFSAPAAGSHELPEASPAEAAGAERSPGLAGGRAALLEARSERHAFPIKPVLNAAPMLGLGFGSRAPGRPVDMDRVWPAPAARRPTRLSSFVLRPPSFWSSASRSPESEPPPEQEEAEEEEEFERLWDEDEREAEEEGDEDAFVEGKAISKVLVTGWTGDQYWVAAPRSWIRKFLPGSAKAAHNWFITGGEDYVAQLAADPSSSVVFRTMHLDNGEDESKATAEREISKKLRFSGHVVQRFAGRRGKLLDFVLEEATDDTLEGVIHNLDSRPGNVIRNMPLYRSLPILADILRGLVDLDEVGVVHCDLTTEHVCMKEGRALIAGLGSASIVKDWTIQFLRPLEAPHHSQPPESTSGYPTGASCNVWAVGRIFARMHLGGDPVHQAIIGLDPFKEHDPFTRNPDIIKGVHKHIRENFDIRKHPVFNHLPERVQEILPHLLDPNMETRWTAQYALEQVERHAAAQGIVLPPPRAPTPRPQGWRWPPPQQRPPEGLRP